MDEELTCLTLESEGPSSPEPRHEAEIEIAAKGGSHAGRQSGRSLSGSGSSDQGPSLRDSPAKLAEVASPEFPKSPIPNQSDLQATSFRLQLGGLLSQSGHARPIPGDFQCFALNMSFMVIIIRFWFGFKERFWLFYSSLIKFKFPR